MGNIGNSHVPRPCSIFSMDFSYVHDDREKILSLSFTAFRFCPRLPPLFVCCESKQKSGTGLVGGQCAMNLVKIPTFDDVARALPHETWGNQTPGCSGALFPPGVEFNPALGLQGCNHFGRLLEIGALEIVNLLLRLPQFHVCTTAVCKVPQVFLYFAAALPNFCFLSIKRWMSCDMARCYAPTHASPHAARRRRFPGPFKPHHTESSLPLNPAKDAWVWPA